MTDIAIGTSTGMQFLLVLLAPAFAVGALVGCGTVFLYLSMRTDTPMYRAMLLTTVVALLSISAQIAGILFGYFGSNLGLSAAFYRFEQVIATAYLVAFPLLLESIVTLRRRMASLNRVVAWIGIMVMVSILLVAYIEPDLFVSVESAADAFGELSAQARRTAHGPIKVPRDVLLAAAALYTFAGLVTHIRRENARTAAPVASGLVVAAVFGLEDIYAGYTGASFLGLSELPLQKFPLGMTVFALIATAAAILRYVRKAEDVERMRDRLSYLAFFDQLTGLRNRRSFYERMDEVCSRPAAEIPVESVAILIVDLDHFKDINDSLGPEIGDALLVEVRDRLATRIRAEDNLYRIGGDEFAIVISHISKDEQAAIVARKIVSALQLPLRVKERVLYLGGTVGIALHPRDGITSDALIRHADAALVRAKVDRNTYRFYSEDMQRSSFEKMRIAGQLRHALANNEFRVAYQPQFGTDGTVTGAEALLRWSSSELGRIAPARFIPIAEQSGLIIPIGDWVLEQVCRDLEATGKEGVVAVPVSVNVSAKQLKDAEFGRRVLATLHRYRVDPTTIRLEITESVLMEQSALIEATINELISEGITFAIDDFGVGYSSLTYLRHLPVEVVKLDRAFILNIPENEHDCRMVRALTSLINGLSLGMIAEGVEYEEQFSFLVRAGCTTFQGFYFARALNVEAFRELLRSGVHVS